MASIADVFFSAELDDGKLQVQAKAAGDKAGQTLGSSLASGVASQGSKLKTGLLAGLGFGAGFGTVGLVTQGLHAITQGIFDSIDAASNLNETITKSDQIFGKNADAVKAWAKTASSSFGQSQRAALDTASTFAGLFSTVGLSLDDATNKAEALTKLGSDLASFFNTDVADATAAIRSGLAGESEPLRRFNVFLSETAVAAKATQLGMQKVNGQFTEGQKVTARYAIIMEQTKAAQGDFARTADGLANTQRTLQAQWEDASAEIGQALLPVMLELAHVVLNDLIPLLKQVAPVLGGVVHAAGEAAKGVEYLGNTFTDFLDFITPWDGQNNRTADGFKNVTGAMSGFRRGLIETTKDAGQLGPAVAKGLDPKIISAAATAALVVPFRQIGVVLGREGRRLGRLAAGATADGIRDQRDEWDAAWNDFLDALANVETPAKRLARITGRLTSKELANGLRDSRPEVKARATEVLQTTLDELGELVQGGGKVGRQGMDALKTGMKSKNPQIRQAATEIYNTIHAHLPDSTDGTRWGKSIGAGLVAGMKAYYHQIGVVAGNMANIISQYLRTHSPAELGPLSEGGGPEGWGETGAGLFTKGWASVLPDLGAMMGASLRTPQLAAAGAAQMPGPVVNNYYNTANVEGLIQAKDPFAIANALGRVARTGQFRKVSDE